MHQIRGYDLDKTYHFLLIALAFLLPLTVFGANFIIVLICILWIISGEYKIKLIETEVMLDDVYQRNISIFDIEKNLQKTHRLIGIKKKKFNNIYEGYVFSLDLMYLKK